MQALLGILTRQQWLHNVQVCVLDHRQSLSQHYFEEYIWKESAIIPSLEKVWTQNNHITKYWQKYKQVRSFEYFEEESDKNVGGVLHDKNGMSNFIFSPPIL